METRLHLQPAFKSKCIVEFDVLLRYPTILIELLSMMLTVELSTEKMTVSLSFSSYFRMTKEAKLQIKKKYN